MKSLISPVMSTNPSPSVCRIRIEDASVSTLDTAGGVRSQHSDLTRDIALTPVRGVDQPPPRALQKRNHAINVLVIGQLQFDTIALAGFSGTAGIALLWRVNFWRLRIGLAAGVSGVAPCKLFL